jgi:hypothetical protein
LAAETVDLSKSNEKSFLSQIICLGDISCKLKHEIKNILLVLRKEFIQSMAIASSGIFNKA